MTVVPLAFQLASWIPAWWRGVVGGDELVDLIGPDLLDPLAGLRRTTTTVTAYCPELGVGVLPGPKPTTEAAVAAGQAVILHAAPGQPASLLVPQGPAWSLLAAGPARPVSLDLRQAGADMALAVVAAEQELRGRDTAVAAPRGTPSARPLSPDAASQRRGLLVRAARLWTAVAAIPVDQRSPALDEVLRSAAAAALAAYSGSGPVAADSPATRDRRPA
ncbi:MAG TPA: hypothetical protein PLT68_06865 [Actinomycetota bacterium]|nr:hypothetical protein [Actinomycetota bacterium]